MKIKSLSVTSAWKNLEGFHIDFSVDKDITVLLGRNGSAKSNLLETVIRIFIDIDLKNVSRFSYRIEYILEGHLITVAAEEGDLAKGWVEDKSIAFRLLREKYVPTYVVGYYSGSSDRFQELFEAHDRAALKSTLHPIRRGERLAFRRFVCARPEHALFALLAFYLSDDSEIGEFLQEYPRIEAFDSVLIILNKPTWAKSASSPDDFWGAQGPVGELLKSIKTHCLSPFTRTVKISTDSRHKETKELAYLYLPDLTSLRNLSSQYGQDPRALFQALDTMRLSELIADFRIRIKVKGADDSIHTRQLSEGEQQLLTVLGLMKFTQDTGSVYVLDEPDTHLNPAWGLDYLDILRRIGGINKNSHTLLATHDPLLVAGLIKEEIRILSRSENGKVVAIQPDESPRGIGIAGVLTSELYGLESQLDTFSLRVLKRIYEVSLMKDYPLKQLHLSRLRKIVPGLAATDTIPDPYRNIAKIAYKNAIDLSINSSDEVDVKLKTISKLASYLYTEAKQQANDLH